jgi:hypothetical protein
MYDKIDQNFGTTTTAYTTTTHPPTQSLKTTKFVTNNNMVIIPHPPCSPGVAPYDFPLFPKLKMKLKG